MFKYLTSILALWVGLLVSTATCWAQAKQYLPTGLQLSTDIYQPLYYYGYQKTGPQYEFNATIDFARLMLEGDYGWGRIRRKGIHKETYITSIVKNEGHYFRIGLNYNFIKNSRDHNAAFLGLRYAKSYFRDHLKSILYDRYWGGHLVDSQQANLQARWFEIVAGVRVKVWEWIYMGCTARYKFGKKISHATSHLPFDIIGWGLNEEDALGLNYYIILRIPLQKDKHTPKKNKRRY